MSHPTALGFKLGWRFSEVVPGFFERDRPEVSGIKFPIVGPVPPHGRRTPPLEGSSLAGPFLYVLVDRAGQEKYVGVATEAGLPSPLARWIRPDKITGTDLWAHGTNKRKEKPTVVWLKEGLDAGRGPYELHFTNYVALEQALEQTAIDLGCPYEPIKRLPPKTFAEQIEHALIYSLQPEWNTQKRKRPAPESIGRIAASWYRAGRA